MIVSIVQKINTYQTKMHYDFNKGFCTKIRGRIEDEKPDLVTLDIKMADYNGLDILQDIRAEFYRR